MVAVPVLVDVHAEQPAACIPSAPPLHFYVHDIPLPSSALGSEGGTSAEPQAELWEDQYISPEAWEDLQVRHLLYSCQKRS